jgi:hypothetical protein
MWTLPLVSIQLLSSINHSFTSVHCITWDLYKGCQNIHPNKHQGILWWNLWAQISCYVATLESPKSNL